MREQDPIRAGFREGTQRVVCDLVTSLPALVATSLGVPVSLAAGVSGASPPLPSALAVQMLTGIAAVLWLHRLGEAPARPAAESLPDLAGQTPGVDYANVVETFLFALARALRNGRQEQRRRACREALRDSLSEAAKLMTLRLGAYCEVHLLARTPDGRLTSLLHHRDFAVPGDGAVGHVLRLGKPIVLELSKAVSNDVDAAALRSFGFEQLVGCPVVRNGNVAAVLLSIARGYREFDVADRRFVDVLAAQATVVWVDPLHVPEEGSPIRITRSTVTREDAREQP